MKTDPTSPTPGEAKRVHFMESEGLNLNSTSTEATVADGNEDMGNNQLHAQPAVEVPVGESASATPDKDSSTITIFNENSEVRTISILMRNKATLRLF